jgi:hypothetical protein
MTSTRAILPARRESETFNLNRGGTRFAVTVSYYAPGRPAEVFITGAKAGSDVEAIARDGAVLLSIALQFGVPLDVIRGALTRESNDDASTIVGAVVDRLAQP